VDYKFEVSPTLDKVKSQKCEIMQKFSALMRKKCIFEKDITESQARTLLYLFNIHTLPQ